MKKIVTTQIDDRDPAVVYSRAGKWSQQASTTAFNDTLTLTQEQGAAATLAFRGTSRRPVQVFLAVLTAHTHAHAFTGTRVSVYGQVAAGGTHAADPASAYSVDGAPPTAFTGVQNGSARVQTRFFMSPPLADGPHALVITALGAGAYFWLDFFLVEAPDASASVPGGGETPPGTVAGGTLGAVVGVGLLLLAVAAFVRRKRRKGPPPEIAIPFTTGVSTQWDAYASPSPVSSVSRKANSASHASASVSHTETTEGAGPTPRGVSAVASSVERAGHGMVPVAGSWGDESGSPPGYSLESGQLGL